LAKFALGCGGYVEVFFWDLQEAMNVVFRAPAL
jgi:hypothetical protein